MNRYTEKLKAAIRPFVNHFGIKRAAALLLALCLVITALPITIGSVAFAEGAASGSDIPNKTDPAPAADPEKLDLSIEKNTSDSDVPNGTDAVSSSDMILFGAPIEGKPISIDGFTLIAWPNKLNYHVGDYIDLSGLAVEITYVYNEDVENFGDDAPLYMEVIHYTILDKFIDHLDDYGIKCNYSDYVEGSVANKTLAIANNVESLKLFYGKNGANIWDTGICPTVYPTLWKTAGRVSTYDDGDYILVADGKCVLTNKTIDTTIISGALSEDALAVQAMNIDNTTGVIRDIASQLEKTNGLKLNDILWTAAFDISDGVCSVIFQNDSALLSDREISDSAVSKNKWALVSSSSATDWRYENGTLYSVKSECIESVNGTVIDVIDTSFFVALDDAGYLYLTKDASKAAQIDLYKLGSKPVSVEKIEVVNDADKMEYNVGDAFDADGMTVNLIYTDGTVICVPYSLFSVYGVYTVADNIDNLTSAEDGAYVKVCCNDCYDLSNSPLKVNTVEKDSFVLADGELATSLYAIVWADIDGKLLSDTTYCGIALSSDEVVYARLHSDKTDYTISTLCGEAVTFRNGTLGVEMGDTFVDGEITTVWQVTRTDNVYTISIPGTSTYLNRVTLNKYGKWALAGNSITSSFDVNSDQLLVLGNLCANSYWNIDGSQDASIESSTHLRAASDSSIILDSGVFYADVSTAANENFYFFKKVDSAVTPPNVTVPQSLDIIDQPVVNYKAGEKLDLKDLVVKITYSDGTLVVVRYDDFGTYGLTTNYANGTVLTTADNDKPIVVSLGELNATGAALKVTSSSGGSSTTDPSTPGKDDGATPSTGDVTRESNPVAIAITANLALISLMVIILATMNRDYLLKFFESKTK